MGVFDSIGDWTNDVSQSSNEQSKEELNKLLEVFEAQERERLKREKIAYIEMFKPEDKEFVYKQFEGLTSEEMKEIAESTYNDFYYDGIDSIENEYNNSLADADNDIIIAEKESKENSDIVKDNLDKDIKDFRDNAYLSGILDSSIVGSKNTQLDGVADEELDEIIKGLEASLVEANEYKKKAAEDKLSNEDELLGAFNSKVDKHINGQSSQQQKEQDKIDAHNKAVKKEEEKYELYKKQVEFDKGQEYDAELDKKYKDESRYGYTGDRKKHYEKRVATAKAFYDKFDSDEVLDMIKANPQLPELLGYEYRSFVDDYRNA